MFLTERDPIVWDGVYPTSDGRFESGRRPLHSRLNQRLLTAAAVLLLWGFTLIAVSALDPTTRAMLAGEGMLYAEVVP